MLRLIYIVLCCSLIASCTFIAPKTVSYEQLKNYNRCYDEKLYCYRIWYRGSRGDTHYYSSMGKVIPLHLKVKGNQERYYPNTKPFRGWGSEPYCHVPYHGRIILTSLNQKLEFSKYLGREKMRLLNKYDGRLISEEEERRMKAELTRLGDAWIKENWGQARLSIPPNKAFHDSGEDRNSRSEFGLFCTGYDDGLGDE